MKLDNPIGTVIEGVRWHKHTDPIYRIMGVVKDFHFNTLKSDIDNLVIYPVKGLERKITHILVRIKDENNPEIFDYMRSQWAKYTDNYPFRYSFLQDDLHNLYTEESQTQKIFNMFAVLSILIASLGLYGLALFMLNRKEKEMGIRKTLGASMLNLRMKLMRQFFLWVFIASLIAFPVAYFVLKSWLNEFAYHIEPHALDFLLALVMVLIMVFSVIIYHVFKISRVNPATALKDE
jgi:putative ABC transport system permease protein